jgi:hypothetical protein
VQGGREKIDRCESRKKKKQRIPKRWRGRQFRPARSVHGPPVLDDEQVVGTIPAIFRCTCTWKRVRQIGRGPMPLVRYLAYTCGVLLALLFLIDWYLPRPVVDPRHADVDRSTIRIHSMHKWPSAVVFDTSQPTTVPPAPAVAAEAPPVAAETPVPSAPREAFASAAGREPAPPAAAPPPATASKHATRGVRVARARSARIASTRSARIASYERHTYERPSYEMFGFRPLFAGGW